MPCQEPPVAMSTWQASIHVPEGCVVLMSGNELVGITAAKDDQGKGIDHYTRFCILLLHFCYCIYELIATHASVIGHFRVPKTLTFKMRLGAQPFL